MFILLHKFLYALPAHVQVTCVHVVLATLRVSGVSGVGGRYARPFLLRLKVCALAGTTKMTAWQLLIWSALSALGGLRVFIELVGFGCEFIEAVSQ